MQGYEYTYDVQYTIDYALWTATVGLCVSKHNLFVPLACKIALQFCDLNASQSVVKTDGIKRESLSIRLQIFYIFGSDTLATLFSLTQLSQ
jgi:hypothetical protein